jgi:AAA family ATP:ADP antiporter
MRPLFARAQPEERRQIAAAAGTIALVLIAHAVLETARDALFLSNVPPTRLPWLYLALAGLVIASRPLLTLGGASPSRGSLVAIQCAAAAGTAAFALVTPAPSTVQFYALYLWGGLAAMIILIRLWLLLSVRFTASQAKRLFPYVASGAVAGALVGYGGAGLLSARLAPRGLLAVSAVVFLLSALSTLLWPSSRAAARASAAPAPLPTLRESLATVARHAYVQRVAALMLLANAAMTLVDFAFKSVVSRSVPSGRLATFFASAYFSIDLVSLLLLIIVVGPLVRWAGVTRALAVRPALLIGAGAVLTATGGLWPVLALRGIDGALRGSLHKTAAELLYIPMSPRLRVAVKEISDGVAHRGGQALGSLVILGWLLIADDERWLGPVIVACAAAWIAVAAALRQPYLNLFRETLSDAANATRLDFPELDLASLETAVASLNSRDDARVIAGLDLLAESGRARLIPALILYHPAPAVVVRALEHCTAARRADVLPLCERLLDHADPAVRGAAIRCAALVAPVRKSLERAAASPCPIVACTALIAAAARGWSEPAAARARVVERLGDAARAAVDERDGDTPAAADPRPFVARALRDHPQAAFADVLGMLARDGDPRTQREALQAIGALRDPAHLPICTALLAVHDIREAARAALLAYGGAALDHLDAVWDDPDLRYEVRVHLPRTVSRFPGQRPADLLLRRLLAEPRGMVRYKILRGLGRKVQEDPAVRLDDAVLDQVIERHLANTFQLLHARIVLERAPHGGLPTHHLLLELLRQKEHFAVERIFRVLGLRYRGEDFARIYDGLQSAAPEARSSSRELIEHLLPPRLRNAVAGLVDELPDDARLATGADYYTPEAVEAGAMLAALRGDRSPLVAALAAYHAAAIEAVAPAGGGDGEAEARRREAV